jgi:hypothetical protein
LSTEERRADGCTYTPIVDANGFQDPHAATSKHFHEPTLSHQGAAGLRERLREHYAQLMAEPIPEIFLQILEPLDQKGRAGHG